MKDSLQPGGASPKVNPSLEYVSRICDISTSLGGLPGQSIRHWPLTLAINHGYCIFIKTLLSARGNGCAAGWSLIPFSTVVLDGCLLGFNTDCKWWSMTNSQLPHYRVTAALIPAYGRLFIAQRPSHKKFGLCWEFPGGKVDPDESLEHCLRRELREELNWDVQVGGLFGQICHQQSDYCIDLFAFWTEVCGGRLELREHVACEWVAVDALRRYTFTEADRLLIMQLEKLSVLPDLPSFRAAHFQQICGDCCPHDRHQQPRLR